MQPTPQDWYTARECAASLKMSLRTFRQYVAAGVFPKGLRGGKLWDVSDLQWMKLTVRYDNRLAMLSKVWESEDDDEKT